MVGRPGTMSMRLGPRLFRLLTEAVKTDGQLRRSLLAICDQGVVSVVSFATVILLGRCTTESELGLYYLPLTVLMVMVNLQSELVTAPYTVYRQRRDGEEFEQYTGSAVVHQTLIMVAGFGLLVGLWGLARCGWLNPQLAPPFRVLLVAGPCWLARGFLRYLSFANLQFGRALVMDVAASVVQLVCLGWLAASGRLDAVHTYATMAIACAVGCAGWWAVRQIRFTIVWSRIGSDWRRNWSFARWALASQLVGCMTPYVLPWLLARYHGEGAAGLLAAGTNLCGLAMMFVLGVAHALTPHAARAFAAGGVPALTSVLRKTSLVFGAAVGAFCLAILFAGPWAMRVVYGDRFGEAGAALIFLAFGVLATSQAIAAGNGLWAVDRPRTNLIGDATTLVVTVVLAVSLVGPWGVTGVAAAIGVGNTVGAATRWLVLRRVLRDFSRTPLATV